ncbi:PEP/pyruvate-binding domain-containing protein [Candidatus Amarolinea aalborgensis]|uniref:PEP/pyruvate-binding domain-containing protein n=1 Tax=Candidatus Amarolinea aalborgensis TaxID=2249329 RepID=UPI003BF99C4C
MTSLSQPTWILPLASDQAALALVGGKGANLARLARAGLPVPDGFLIATPAYMAFLTANELTARIVDALPAGAPDSPDQAERASTLIRGLFDQGRIPLDLAAQILAAYANLGRPAVAVRSSATAEDLPEMSFAGQQDTYLNVVGDEALLAAVVDCWSSLWTARAINYRARNRVPHSGAALAVVVQKMVESQASGVLFTANPLTGLRTETVIDATVGLGEALVAGQVEPDHYVVDTRSGQITGRTLGAKAMSIRGRPGGGTVAVQEDQAAAQALPDAQIQALAALGRRVAELYHTPQDIEWAWANDTLYLLQARPITSLFPVPDDLAPAPLMVMFSFGAVQGMLDPVTPLGRDILREVMVAVGQLFGIPASRGPQRVLFTAGERLWANFTPVLRNPIGRRIARGAMGFLDPAAGEAITAIWQEPALQPGRRRISPHAAAQVARFLIPVVGNVLLNLLSPGRRRRAIIAHGERVLVAVQARSAAIQGDPRARLAQLARLVPQSLEEYVPRTFRVFISGVASGMASYNMLRVLSKRVAAASANGSGDWGERILQVTRGLPYNPTTEMDLALWQVAQTIQADASARRAFQAQPPAELAARYRAGALPDAAQRAFEPFMARYGARGLAEIDLGRPRWSEEPAHLMEVVAGYLQITDRHQAPDAVFARGAAAAQAIINQMAAAAQQGPHGWLKARLIRLAAGRTRMLMALRESPKFFVVRLLGIFRQDLLTIGQELAAAGELAQPDDLVYLSLSELAAFADGKPADWAALISQRRAAFQREQMRRQIPRLLLSDGRAFYAGVTSRGEGAGALTGSPVSPGSVEGRVRVVLDPRSAGLLPGEILVCRGTDPSWTPLFLTAAGLIMEVGGMMTHGAVVAREYGIPAVVGVDRATERLATGQRIALNGSNGEIRLLDEAAQPA